MNSGSIHGSPSAEHSIASQKDASGAAAKAAHAKLRKRPEDDVASDATAAADSDEQIVVAQATPDASAQGSASADAASASAAPAPAAEGSAAAGAGVPAAAPAIGSSGLSFGAIALGAGTLGAVGLAAAGGGGGGGGGTTAATVPTPIHNFGEYVGAVNSGAATAATNAAGTVRADGTVNVDISGGIARGALPKPLSDLRPMNYNVTNANVTTINDGGVAVDVQGNADARVTAHSDAGAGSSNLMWMQNLAVRDAAGQGETVATASATAAGAGSDAEIGVQHLSMALAGTGALNGRTDLLATATGGGSAHTLLGDVTLHVDSSATGTDAAPVSSQVHMGFGEGEEAGMLASASGAGSSANLSAGSLSLSARGDDAYAFNSGLFAQGTDGGSAHNDIGGNVSFAADGRAAHSYILVDASTDATAGSAADVHIHGNVDLQSTGSDSALTRAAVRADGDGTVEIDGHLNVHSSGALAPSSMQVIAQGGDGHVDIGSVGMNVEGGSHAWMDLYADHSGGLNIGAVNLSVSADSDITLHVQNANDAVNGVVDATFLAHGDSTAPVSIGTANVGGAGEVHMNLNTQTFGTINQAASIERMDLHYQLADQDAAGVGSAPMTTINGFTGNATDVTYNGVVADATNFTDAGSFTSLADLNSGIDAALDGTHKYVFAVYNGTEDINGNGMADDHGSGVLAFDDNGAGVTSVLMLPGVTTVTPTDLA